MEENAEGGVVVEFLCCRKVWSHGIGELIESFAMKVGLWIV